MYLAGRYGRREELLAHAVRLDQVGHRITSRWVFGEHGMQDDTPNIQEARQFAEDDIQDLVAADVLVAFTESPGNVKGRARGGRHVELGYALGVNMPVYVIGHRENVFCHLPAVENFASFEAFIQWLARKEAV